MSKPNPLPPQDRLRTLFSYDADTGILRWRERGPGRRLGGAAGDVNKRRRRVRIDYVLFFTARIIWKWVHGVDPLGEVDHADTDSLNDRLDNLRDATSRQNHSNRSGWSASGFKGVTPHKGKYQARLMIEGVTNTLGSFATAQEAADLYDAIAVEVFGPFARTNAMIRASAVI